MQFHWWGDTNNKCQHHKKLDESENWNLICGTRNCNLCQGPSLSLSLLSWNDKWSKRSREGKKQNKCCWSFHSIHISYGRWTCIVQLASGSFYSWILLCHSTGSRCARLQHIFLERKRKEERERELVSWKRFMPVCISYFMKETLCNQMHWHFFKTYDYFKLSPIMQWISLNGRTLGEQRHRYANRFECFVRLTIIFMDKCENEKKVSTRLSLSPLSIFAHDS